MNLSEREGDSDAGWEAFNNLLAASRHYRWMNVDDNGVKVMVIYNEIEVDDRPLYEFVGAFIGNSMALWEITNMYSFDSDYLVGKIHKELSK